MRYVKTIILHLYLDTESPTHLCGNLQMLPRRKLTAFKDQTELIGLLEKCSLYEPDAAAQIEETQPRPDHENSSQ